MIPLDQIDPRVGLPVALILWVWYVFIRLHERKVAREEQK